MEANTITQGPKRGTVPERGAWYKDPTERKCRVFISHAGAKTMCLVDSLWEELKRSCPTLEVFLDCHASFLGESVMHVVDAALRDALVGAPPTRCSVCLRHSWKHSELK
jgi:hypothetical protein